MSNDIKKAVNDYLQSLGVTVQSVLVAELQKQGDWLHDLWSVSIVRMGKPALITPYKTGTGHRVLHGKRERQTSYVQAKQEEPGLRKVAAKNHYSSISSIQCVKVPTASDVLYSLLLDASSGEDTFSNFCANCGYDDDSRKALAIYLECQKIGEQLRAIFSPTEREQLRELLQDY